MKRIPFYKMSGSGNDFIIIDNRKDVMQDINIKEFAAKVCTPRVSLGADGLILIENSTKADFKWRLFNADGSEAEMSGNGARCAARFACINRVASFQMFFETLSGIIKAEVKDDRVMVQMPDPKDIRLDHKIEIDGREYQGSFINTGVPHFVYFVEDVEKVDVVELGRKTRYHSVFRPSGTNVNFARVIDSQNITIRTYERGVEDETLACGTGSVATALIAGSTGRCTSPVVLATRGGMPLFVSFSWDGERFRNVFLGGDARVICAGEIWEEAWQ